MNNHTTNDAGAAAAALSEALDRVFRLDGTGTTELLLVRHAEPDAMLDSTVDPALSEAGRWQAAQLAERLRATAADAVYTSATRCGTETAAVIAEAHGLPYTEVHDLSGIRFHSDRLSAAAAPGAELAARLVELLVERPTWDALPGLEPSRVFRHRTIQAVEALLARHVAGRIVVVTHASAINAYLSMVLDIPRDMFFMPGYASISTVHLQGDLYSVRGLNDQGHVVARVDAEPALAR
jgi:probable phosphoglycerate mutase